MDLRTLLVGKNKGIVSDFFLVMNDSFESMTSSMRPQDLEVHVKYFQPHAVVYCMDMENKEDINAIANLYDLLKKEGIPLVLIGDPEDCDSFVKISGKSVDMELRKPMTLQVMRERLENYLMKRALLEKKAGLPQEKRSGGSISGADSLLQEVEREMAALRGQSAMPSAAKEEPGRPQESGEKRRIMIIDDSTSMLRAIKSHLGEQYELATAISGKIALKYLQKRTVDLILLDYEMPEMDGPEVYQKLQENPETAGIPVIFLTGINDTSKIQKALSLKPKGYLLKPVDREALLTKIEEVMN
ncbi:MAG: response regulator [Roseburia sp.]|nr:response regulator [Roseburia sp.]